MKKIGCCLFLVVFCCFACRKSSNLEEALTSAGENRAELEKVLKHYENDSLKYKAACFLIENMMYHYTFDFPGIDKYHKQIEAVFLKEDTSKYFKDNWESQLKELENMLGKKQLARKYDSENITALYLINHIDKAFEAVSYPWCKDLSFDDFCEYILPYRMANEPPEDWMSFFRNEHAIAIDSFISVNAADSTICKYFIKKLIDYTTFHLCNIKLMDPPASYMPNIKAGTCHDQCIYGNCVMRSIGIPVAWDFTPQWGGRSMGHDWMSVLLSGNQEIPFQLGDEDDTPFGTHITKKKFDRLVKVYRKTFGIQHESLFMQNLQEDIPAFFKDPFFKDVTHLYLDTVSIPVQLTLPPPSDKQVVYIMVFDNKDWVPIDWAYINKDKAVFRNMGKNCMYIAMYYHDRRFYAASDPFYVSHDNQLHYVRADLQKREEAHLLRKYPDYFVQLYNRGMQDGTFQASNVADFSKHDTLYMIKELPSVTYHQVPVYSKQPYRYVRYYGGPESSANIAELEFYTFDGDTLRKLTGKIIGTPGSYMDMPDRTKAHAFDGDPLTFFDAPKSEENHSWVGLDLGKPYPISQIAYLPRNKGNIIEIGDEYELVYWNQGKWDSLGKKIATDYILIYDNVPEGALLLLHNLTKGIEERIFTYQREKQVWW